MSLPSLVLLFCPCEDCALAHLPTPLDPPNYKEQRPTATFIGIWNESRVSSTTIDNSERNMTIYVRNDFRNDSVSDRPDVTLELSQSDSFRFSLLDFLLLLSETLLSYRNTFASSCSTLQCADCLVAAVVHYNLSPIVGTATYTSYLAMCAGTTCLYLRVPWAEVIRGPLCVSLFNDKERREQKGFPWLFLRVGARRANVSTCG